MIVLSIALKLILFVSIINVWFVRFNKPTQWRGGGAGSMKDEFRAYGLTGNLVYASGSGLAIKYLFDEVEAGADPLGPANKLIFMTGPLTGNCPIPGH